MAIKGNVGKGVIAVAATDTTLVNPTGDIERAAVSALSLHNTTGAGITVTLYHSPDGTSASGVIVDVISVAANTTIDASSQIGQGFTSAEYLVAVGSGAGVNAQFTLTEYTAGS